MKLWIRNQDRERFSLAKDIRFGIYKKCDLDKGMHTIKEFMESGEAYCIECNGEFFGEYATRERCLEIIDEIQNIMCRSGMILFKDIDTTNLSPKDIEPFKSITWSSSPISNEKSEVTIHNAEVIVYEMPEK